MQGEGGKEEQNLSDILYAHKQEPTRQPSFPSAFFISAEKLFGGTEYARGLS